MNQDAEHLQLLSIFHYVVAAIVALISCFPVFHLIFGIFFLAAPDAVLEVDGTPPPAGLRTGIGLMFTVIPTLIILTGWTVAGCVVFAGRNLARHTRHSYCLVVAAILCTFMPFGTALGIITIIVLARPSVKTIFDKQNSTSNAWQ